MMSYLHTKFHENRISSFRGVAMTRLMTYFVIWPRARMTLLFYFFFWKYLYTGSVCSDEAEQSKFIAQRASNHRRFQSKICVVVCEFFKFFQSFSELWLGTMKYQWPCFVSIHCPYWHIGRCIILLKDAGSVCELLLSNRPNCHPELKCISQFWYSQQLVFVFQLHNRINIPKTSRTPSRCRFVSKLA